MSEQEAKKKLDRSQIDGITGGIEDDGYNDKYECARCHHRWPKRDGKTCPVCDGTPRRDI